jgi:hypothetical protein
MADLLDRLKAGRTAVARKRILDVEFGLRILTEQDYLQAQIATEQAMKSAGMELSVSTAEMFESEKASQLLVRALIDPDSGKPVADSAKALREALSREDKAALVEAYLEHEKSFSPSELTLSEEEFSSLLDEVKKNPLTKRLRDSSSETLRRLITSLVAQPAT